MNFLWVQFVLGTTGDAERSFGGLEAAGRIFGEHWNDSDFLPVRWLVVAGLIIAAILTPMLIHRWHRHHQLRSKPLLTFHDLASHVGLSLKDQWLLMKIGRGEALATPLTLLLSRSTLRHHAERYAQSLSTRRRVAVLRRIAAMRQMLYDS